MDQETPREWQGDAQWPGEPYPRRTLGRRIAEFLRSRRTVPRGTRKAPGQFRQRLRFIAPFLVLLFGAMGGGLLIATAPEVDRHLPPPTVPTVETLVLHARDYPLILKTQGTVSPRTQSTLIPEVAGRIIQVSPNFRPGGFFEAGDVLLTIDPRDYKNAVTTMQAELAQARLALEEEEARAEQARTDWKRLGGEGEGSSLALRRPQLASKQAAAAAAMSRLLQARLGLERTQIQAPYAGRILEQAVDVGQYVSSGTVLASIYAVDYVEIRLPLTDEQAYFVHLPEAYRASGEKTPAFRTGPRVTLSAEIARKEYRWEGRIVRTEGSVDLRTRQIFVVAQVDDPYARQGERPPLKVGRFVKAEIHGRVLHGVFVVPSVAVRFGNQLWLVGKGDLLEQRQVEVIRRDADHVIIGGGLREGERLVLTPLPYGVGGTKVHIVGAGGKKGP